MSIQEIFSNIKQSPEWRDMLTGAILVFVGVISFVLGRYSAGEHAFAPVVENEAAVQTQSIQQSGVEDNEGSRVGELKSSTINNAESQENGAFAASKNGTKYHLPWCSGAKRIKEENKVWFATKEEAEQAGYSPAANCEGI